MMSLYVFTIDIREVVNKLVQSGLREYSAGYKGQQRVELSEVVLHWSARQQQAERHL